MFHSSTLQTSKKPEIGGYIKFSLNWSRQLRGFDTLFSKCPICIDQQLENTKIESLINRLGFYS
jgi:hypothetical protein